MSANVAGVPAVNDTLPYRISELEARRANLLYLLRFPQIGDAHKERLQRVLVATEAELLEAEEIWNRSPCTKMLSTQKRGPKKG